MNNLSPIVLFVYNRTDHTKETVNSILKSPLAVESVLYIFSDAAKTEESKKNVESVREYIHSIKGFKEIIIEESEKNKGLAKSVIAGVSKVLEKHNSAIILEDDLLVSPNFLEYMNKALSTYSNDKRIHSVTGYCFPIEISANYNKDVFLSYRTSSWGWGTWSDRWSKANWDSSFFYPIIKNKNLQKKFNRAGSDYSPMLIKQLSGKIDSWAIRWAFNQMINNSFTLFPVKSLVKNIGLDGSGTHTKKRKRHVVELTNFSPVIKPNEKLEINEEINYKIKKLNSISVYRRIRNFLSYGIY